jgi:hypothetical protein
VVLAKQGFRAQTVAVHPDAAVVVVVIVAKCFHAKEKRPH